MKIQFLGAVRTVTGSMHLLTVNGSRLLLDCGMFQGRRSESLERNRNLPFDPHSIGTLILSHAHIDHSGNIPTLVKNGFRGNILATSASRDLCASMLRDAGHIQEQDIGYLNKKRAKQGLPALEPLYTVQDATDSLGYFVGLEYKRPLLVAPGVTLTFLDAGHILGSAITVLDVEEDGQVVRIAFTGDLGRKDRPILRDPQWVEGVDYLLVESTYGGRYHDSFDRADEELRDVIVTTYRRGGKVIVPAFAVGRRSDHSFENSMLHLWLSLPQARQQPVAHLPGILTVAS
jgi:metallo-beta-lactamase family protein